MNNNSTDSISWVMFAIGGNGLLSALPLNNLREGTIPTQNFNVICSVYLVLISPTFVKSLYLGI